MARKTMLTANTAHRGIRLPAASSWPAASDTPQTVVQEVVYVRQTTQPPEDVIYIAGDAE